MTLTGPPGIGKSAIAEALASDEAADIAGAAPPLFVALGAVEKAAGLVAAIAAAQGLPAPRVATPESSFPALARALGGDPQQRRASLLVFDDAEAVVGPLAALVVLLRRSAPWIRVLVTSRERLRVDAETVIPVAPLGLPEGDADVEALAEAEASRLFVARAEAANARFRPTPENAAAIARIVRYLEGVPLAIVLAASRAGVLDVAQIEAMIREHIDLFEETGRQVPARQRTLGRAIAWSWNTLTAGERSLLGRLSLFRGELDLEAATAVALGPEGRDRPRRERDRDRPRRERDRARVAQELEALHDRSLIEAVATAEAEGAPMRYRLLGIIREFVAERLETSRGRAAAEKAFVAHFASGSGTHDFRIEGTSSFSVANREHAVSIALRQHDDARAAQIVLSLGPWFLARGPYARYDELLGTVLGQAKKVRPKVKGELLLMRGITRIFSGARNAAMRDLREALALGDAATRVHAMSKMGMVLGLGGHIEKALALLGKAEAQLPKLGRPDIEGRVFKDAANVLSEAGESSVHDYLVRARACFERAEEPREVAFVELLLAGRYCDEGRVREGRRACEAALVRFAEVGDARSPAWTHTLLGLLEQESGAFELARERFDQALGVARTVGDAHTEALILGLTTGLALERGDAYGASLRAGGAAVALQAVGDDEAAAHVTGMLGVAQAELGHTKAASAAFRRARRMLPEGGRAARREALDLFSLALEVERAKREERIDAYWSSISHQDGSRSGRSEEVRFAWRVLRRLSGAPNAAAVAQERTLTVGAEGTWFAVDRAPRVDLSRQRVLRRVLVALLRERERTPGRAVEAATLVARVWQGERILPAAALNRLYVALNRLRERGLGVVLVRRPDGYLLDPDVALRQER
ncbi:MAG: hypothetical protein HOO96_10600 [Polyangiaceae bacterium]|nr:hypothetical protein [Polyangiaceae bacterium]